MLRFKFCRVGELDRKTKRIISRRMSWSEGVMREWICDQRMDIHLCLLYNKHLVTWISIHEQIHGQTYGHIPGVKYIGAWTALKYRKRGYAQVALLALINHEREELSVTDDTVFWAYDLTVANIVKRLGCKVHARCSEIF